MIAEGECYHNSRESSESILFLSSPKYKPIGSWYASLERFARPGVTVGTAARGPTPLQTEWEEGQIGKLRIAEKK